GRLQETRCFGAGWAFVSQRIKILCLARYGPSGASSRYRMYQYLPALRSSGLDVVVHPLLGGSYVADLYAGRRQAGREVVRSLLRRLWVVSKARRFDLVWIDKEVVPWFPGIL